MSRVMVWAFVIGVILLVAGMLASATAAGPAILFGGILILGGLAVVAMVKAQRVHGARWDVNPGAARREAAAERKAQERKDRLAAGK